MGLRDLFRKKEEPQIELKFTNNIECELLFENATECLQEKRNKEALELFDKLLEKEPMNIHAINGKGSALMQDKLYDEALIQFDKSLSIKENEIAYMNKAIIYANTAEYDKALTYCDKTIEIKPEMKDIAMGLRNNIIEVRNKNNTSNKGSYNSKARELIEKAQKLMDENGTTYKFDSSYQQDTREFKKITLWMHGTVMNRQ